MCACVNQGCKRDLFFRDRDETETETFRGPDRDVFRDVANGTIQPVKLLASNCYKLCLVSFIYYAIHSSVSATVLQKIRAIFPKTVSNLKTSLLYSITFMQAYIQLVKI